MFFSNLYDDPYVNVSGKPYLQKVHNWTYLRDILLIISIFLQIKIFFLLLLENQWQEHVLVTFGSPQLFIITN